jgi:ATP-binding cassette subfamily F protein uup
VGIIGPNGCGKTTLLNLLLGKLPPQQGQIELGSQVTPLYFDQLRAGIDLEKTVWENVAPEGGDTVFINGRPRHVIGYLQDFLFTSDRARTPVKILSGGERHRLLLARLFTNPSNLLVFDEPTNDLDTETLELLEEVLAEYPGTLLVVSHDREFLNNVVTSALIFGQDGTLNEYVGGYDDWERQLAAAEAAKPMPITTKDQTVSATPKEAKAVRKLSFKEKRDLETLPGLIEALDTEQEKLHTQLADFVQCQKPGFVPQAKARLTEIEKELANAYLRWEELEGMAKAGQ